MNLENYHSIIIVTNYGGKIEIRDSNGVVISPEAVIDFMTDVKAEILRQLNGK